MQCCCTKGPAREMHCQLKLCTMHTTQRRQTQPHTRPQTGTRQPLRLQLHKVPRDPPRQGQPVNKWEAREDWELMPSQTNKPNDTWHPGLKSITAVGEPAPGA